jgi:hypothetical protein
LEIRSEGGDLVKEMTTDDGRYEVDNLSPGNYLVTEVDPLGYRSTTPNRVQARVRANISLVVNFGDISNSLAVPHRLFFPVQQN